MNEQCFWMVEEEADWIPPVNLTGKGDRLVMEVDLPGVEKDNLKISLEDNLLWLRGERRLEEEKKDVSYFCCERVGGTFSRRIRLPYKVQEDKIETAFKNGVLTIILPKAKELLAREIKIA